MSDTITSSHRITFKYQSLDDSKSSNDLIIINKENMQLEKGYIYHIYNQGNNQRKIFYKRENYLFFSEKIKTYILPYADILAWCLMPNHFHLMVLVKEEELSLESDKMTQSHLITEKQYPQVCFNYIHQNPVKANLVKNETDWEFSSAKNYANLKEGKLVNKEVAFEYIDIK
ncbi:MAG: hypothetical protein L3J20_04650 [Flavobacteriaceae bacterium]|nr:hypothetical protein [Flavobacteriaceae bacterium]